MTYTLRLAVSFWLVFTAVCSTLGDEKEIRQTVDAYVTAFNKGDVKALATMWAEDGVHTDRVSGARTAGKKAILADLAEAFRTQPEARLAATVNRVRLITADVANVEGQTALGGGGETPEMSTFSAILVRQNDRWLLSSIEEMNVATPSSPQEALGELAWLVGKWRDTSDKVTVDTTVRWSNSNAFLLRSFVAMSGEEQLEQGTQVIGWDPRSQQIRSWSFNSDGSFGDGQWNKNGEDWVIHSSQTLADGRAATGSYILTRTGDNAISLRLVGHEIEGEPQPATPAAQVERVADNAEVTPAASSQSEK